MHRHHRLVVGTGADGILLDMTGKLTIWKPDASHLSFKLVVILLLSWMKSRLR